MDFGLVFYDIPNTEVFSLQNEKNGKRESEGKNSGNQNKPAYLIEWDRIG